MTWAPTTGSSTATAEPEHGCGRLLDCGILRKGFSRVHCPTRNQSALVAFACKARAVCPSCTGRRMVETAAHLCDYVPPHVPMRQWVPSLPHAVRVPMVRDRPG